MDEAATVIFSLGNSSHQLPLGELLSLQQLLEPLTPHADATVGSAIRYLMQEDNHPPAYFALSHLWMDRFPPVQGVASLWAARALPALLGALAIPFVYLTARISFNSAIAGQLAAALMAVSPFGVAISQEARHYGMATLLVAMSLACYAAVVRALQTERDWPLWLGFAWVGVNALGVATHYFISLTLLAEGLVLAVLGWQQARRDRALLGQPQWLRVYWAALGSLLGCLIWVPVLLNFQGNEQSSSLAIDFSQPIQWVNPLAQALAGLLFFVVTPATVTQGAWRLGVVILSAPVMLVLVVWLVPLVVRAARRQSQFRDGKRGLFSLGGFVLAALGVFLVLSYGAGIDITRGHRYNFVFHGGAIAALGGILAADWLGTNASGPLSTPLPLTKRRIPGRRIVQILWGASLVSALFVVTNLSFPKYYNPNVLVQWMQSQSSDPIVVGFPTRVTDQPTVIGHELLSIGWQIQRDFNPAQSGTGWVTPPRFFILPSGPKAPRSPEASLDQILTGLPGPIDLWILNFDSDLSRQQCPLMATMGKGGHYISHYRCGG
jgi:uncharacterized membrane protein